MGAKSRTAISYPRWCWEAKLVATEQLQGVCGGIGRGKASISFAWGLPRHDPSTNQGLRLVVRLINLADIGVMIEMLQLSSNISSILSNVKEVWQMLRVTLARFEWAAPQCAAVFLWMINKGRRLHQHQFSLEIADMALCRLYIVSYATVNDQWICFCQAY